MLKLHELLAVEKSLENQANKVRTDLISTFEKKRHLFEEKRTVFYPSDENEKVTTEAQSDIQSTVRKELDWVSGHLIKALDAAHAIAVVNTQAKGDVVLDDDAETVLLTGIPATSLLELEKRAVELHALVSAIPTLDPAKGFIVDPNRAPIFKAREVNKARKVKSKRVIVKYEATKEHPAQTEIIDEDKEIGKINEQEWSGLITPSEKSAMLERVEQIGRAVRRARSRANDTEVSSPAKIGAALVRYVFGQ